MDAAQAEVPAQLQYEQRLSLQHGHNAVSIVLVHGQHQVAYTVDLIRARGAAWHCHALLPLTPLSTLI